MRALRVVLVLLAVLLPLYFYFCFDGPPPDVRDLELAVEPVPDAENGFVLAKLEESDIYWPRSSSDADAADANPDADPDTLAYDLATGKKWNEKLAREILEKNARPLEKLEAGLKAPYFQLPPFPDVDVSYDFHLFLAQKRLFFVASIRAWSRFQDGAEREAFEEAMKLVRFGYRLQLAGGPMIHYLVASAIQEMAIANLIHLIERTRLGAGDLEPFCGELSKYSTNPRVVTDCLKHEYAFVSRSVDAMARGEKKIDSPDGGGRIPVFWIPAVVWGSRTFFLPNQTKSL